MKKNIAGQVIGCQMVTAADGTAFTSTVTVYVTGDAGTQALGSVGSGVCTHEGNGYHTYAPSQAETNYDLVAFTFIGTGAVPATIQVTTTFPQTTGIAQAGASGSITLAAGESAVTDFHKGSWIQIISGTGLGQGRKITAYNGTTKVATITPNWATNPAVSSVYYIVPEGLQIIDSTNPISADVVKWLSTACATPTVAGVPEVDLTHVVGSTSSVSALATNVAAILVDTAEIGVAGAGLTNINLPDQTMNITGSITGGITGNITGNLSGSVGSVTSGVTVTTNNDKTGYTLTGAGISSILNTQLTESYASDGVAPTLAQVLMLIQQSVGDFSISGTTITVKRLDGSTTAATYLMNDSTSPTSRTRSS